MLLKGITVDFNNEIHEKIVKFLELDSEPVKSEPFFEDINNSQSKLKEHLQYFLSLGDLKTKIIECLKINPIQLCNSKDCQFPKNIETLDKTILKKLEDLFDYFYRNKLSSSGKLKKHYEKHNLRICPFCTLFPLSATYKPAHDHFLPISKYPYWGADVRNLAPICEDCNTKAKNAKNPLINEETKQRQEILTPYQDETDFELKVSQDKIKLKIDIEPTNTGADCIAKFKAFLKLFNIEQRFNDELNRMEDFLQNQVLKKKIESKNINNLQQFSNLIEDLINDAEIEKLGIPCYFIRLAYLDYVKAKPKPVYDVITRPY